METAPTIEPPQPTRGRLSALVETDAGAASMRVGILLISLVVWFRPDLPDAGARFWHGMGRFVHGLTNVGLLLIFVPGLLIATRWGMIVLAFLVGVVDAVLFGVPRWLFREKLGLGVGGAFLLAFCFEMATAVTAGHYVREALRPGPPIIVGAGVKHKRPTKPRGPARPVPPWINSNL